MILTKEDKELIEEAKKIIVKSSQVKLIDTGDTGCALKTINKNIYLGVSMGFFCGIGSCGEYQAVGNMVSNGEKEIKIIVSVGKDGKIKI